MRNHLLVSVLLLFTEFVSAQTVTILDQNTQQPIPGVSVHSTNPILRTQTNVHGQFDVSTFQAADTIYVKMIGYLPFSFSYSEIESLGFIINLSVDPIALNEVEITSDRWADYKIETPNRVERIDLSSTAFQNPQTAADLLGTSGYVFIQKSQMGGGSPMLRGMATNRVLLVIDGVRMNTAVFRSGNLQQVISLDANAIQSTEVFFGPGSVMYGSDAIGGVMNFQTLEPKFAGSGKKTVVTGNAMMRNSTANSEKTGHFDFNIGLKKVAFVSSFTSSEYGDLRSGSIGGDHYFYRTGYVQTINDKDYMVSNDDSTLQIGSKYSQVNLMQKIRFRPTRYWEIDYGFHFSRTSSYNRYDRLYVMQEAGPYKNKLRWAEWYYGPQKWDMNRVGITHSKATFMYDRLSIVGALQNFEESRYDREFMVRELRMQKETVKALSLNLDMEKALGERATIYYGAELVHNTVNSVATLTHVITDDVDSTVTRYPDGSTWETYGGYVNFNFKLTKKWILNSGIRYSYYKIKAEFDTTFFPFPFTNTVMSNGSLTGSVGCVYTPYKSWQIYVNAASGFRAPNIDDMGKVFESTPGYIVVPNPDLKPEHVYNAEIGTVKTFGNFLKLDFAGYYTLLTDAMVRKDFEFNGLTKINFLGNPSIVQAVQNVTTIRVYGIQAGIDFFYKGIGLESNISYQNGKEQSPDSLIYYPLRHAAPMFGSTHLTYSHKFFRLDFYAMYNAKMDYEDLSLTERINQSYAKDENGLPYSAAWYTLNFKAAFYLNKYVSLTVGVENIMDILYRPYSSGINAPGRNIITSLRARF